MVIHEYMVIHEITLYGDSRITILSEQNTRFLKLANKYQNIWQQRFTALFISLSSKKFWKHFMRS